MENDQSRQWRSDYDVLLRGLAKHGHALPGAFWLATFLREGARRRVELLHLRAHAGSYRGRKAVVQEGLELLDKLKLDQITKQRISEVREVLGLPSAHGPRAVVTSPTRSSVDSPTTSTSPLTSLPRPLLLAVAETNASVARPTAPAPPPLPAPAPALGATPGGLERPTRLASAAFAQSAVTVTKATLSPRGKLDAAAVDGVPPISVLRTNGADGSQVGAALVLVGRSFAQGGYAKIRPALLLAAGCELTGVLAGDYVARTLGLRHKTDAIKKNLRGFSWQPRHRTSTSSLAAANEALVAAGSELLPVLTLRDDKDNIYELVPRLDIDVANAVHQQQKLRCNLAFLRAVFDGVLPRLAGLHAANFLHHDIKPDNLLVDAARGRVVLADYGLARRNEPESIPHRGTHLYRAPEVPVLLCAPDLYPYATTKLTAQADMYAFAVTVATLVAPDIFAASPLCYFRPEEVHTRRPDLVRLVRDTLHRSVGGAAAATVYRRAYATHVIDVGHAYAGWFDDRIGALSVATSATELHWNASPFDRLLHAIAEVDVVLALLVARGLHPDPRRRGTAADWTETVRLRSKRPSTLQVVQLKQQLMAATRTFGRLCNLEMAYSNLARAAASLHADAEAPDVPIQST